MPKYQTDDTEYTDAATGVLKNKLNIRDAQELENAERDISIMRSLHIAMYPVEGQFDLAHLQAIHRKLFGDIYTWAGECRHIDIIKGNSRFAHHQYIGSFCADVAAKLKKEHYLKDLPPQTFSERAAYYMGEFNAAHPFREGNGRALRAFFSQLAAQNGYQIHWKNISQAEMVQASIAAFNGNHHILAALISANVAAVSIEPEQAV